MKCALRLSRASRPDANGIAQTAAAEFVEAARKAVQEKGSFSVALAGGSTANALYSLLANNPLLQALVPWSKIQWFFGDERHVCPDDVESNFRMATEALFSKVPLHEQQVHRIKGEKANAMEAAAEYEDDLRMSFRLEADQLPRFDLVPLGMGAEGHTASLFAGTKVLKELGGETLYGSNHADAPCLKQCGAGCLHGARPGKGSSTQGRAGPYEPVQLPAQLIYPKQGRVMWLADPSAAAMLAPNGKRTR
jgi:6-phosphogluconolactonase